MKESGVLGECSPTLYRHLEFFRRPRRARPFGKQLKAQVFPTTISIVSHSFRSFSIAIVDRVRGRRKKYLHIKGFEHTKKSRNRRDPKYRSTMTH